jgi:O-antigen chain-terminating methyltransferase
MAPNQADSPEPPPRRAPSLAAFLGEPTRDLADWQWLWQGDHEFPIRSHRPFWGALLVAWKRLLRPFVKPPQNDLWERQRVFNLVLVEHLRELRRSEGAHEGRINHLEALGSQGVHDIMLHTDALFARVDQKLDRQRRLAQDLHARLGAALAMAETAQAPALAGAAREIGYLELEDRFRGTPEDIASRLARYVPYLQGKGDVLDLGCGRGESLQVFGQRGIPARGVDGSAQMVARCRELGLRAEQGDLFAHLAAQDEASLGGVVSFHVIEHLPPGSLDRLARLAWRALQPGGVLILETPNPLSLVVAARNFWLDPTHLRPVHPLRLEQLLQAAGFEQIERLDLSPFPPAERLPELDLAALPAEQQALGEEMLRLRDRLDDLLFGFQDYGLIGRKPKRS